jgi:hypothetical protein
MHAYRPEIVKIENGLLLEKILARREKIENFTLVQ